MQALIVVTARRAVRVGLFVGALGLGLAAVSPAAMAASCSLERSPLHQRVYEHASRGPEVLRSFTVRTRGVYGLDLQEENARYAREFAAERACLQAQAVQATPAQASGDPAVADQPSDTASR